jgi:hypothetical protein
MLVSKAFWHGFY